MSGEIIFHDYPQSPVAEKVRAGFGIKGLSYRNVEIPRLPPKPDLMPLTGGYRRTPVMQIGADVYCDSQCILRELERRFPDPTFFPAGNAGAAWAWSRWTEGDLLLDCIRIAICADLASVPEALANDRGRLYFGPDYDLEAVAAAIPHSVSQVRAQFGWMNAQLRDARKFFLGDAPGLPDIASHTLVWFIRGRWSEGPEFLRQFPALEAWEKRIRAIGHGTPTPLSAIEALAIARDADPAAGRVPDPSAEPAFAPGNRVAVVPDTDGGDPPVKGAVHAIDAETIAILRDDPRVGEICIHFPRVGYRITALD